jgi:hypothetical protein
LIIQDAKLKPIGPDSRCASRILFVEAKNFIEVAIECTRYDGLTCDAADSRELRLRHVAAFDSPAPDVIRDHRAGQ